MSETSWQNWDHCQVRRLYVPGRGWDLDGEPADPNLPDVTRAYFYGYVDAEGNLLTEQVEGFAGFSSLMARLGAAGWQLVSMAQYAFQAGLDGPEVTHFVETYSFKRPSGKG